MPAAPVESREHGARERVAGIQRARLLAALVEVCAERGAAGLTVSDIVARAGVSRRTFYELFEDSAACLLAALDEAIATAAARVDGVYRADARWRERIRAALAALLDLLDEQPEIGRLLVVESLAAGPGALRRRARALAALVAAVDEGRAEGRAGVAPGPLTAEGVVGGALAVIHARIARDGRDPPAPARAGDAEAVRMAELVNPLMSMIVLPYLGATAARREAERPVLVSAASPPRSSGNPLADLGLRVTYRTMRVLAAIDAQGGRGSYPSNRQVGRIAGIEDQGQVSKLLARLERVGLIENAKGDSAKGVPNMWRLTLKGREFQAAIEPHGDQSATSASSAATSSSVTSSSGEGTTLPSRKVSQRS
jgi:AcrR family transcriptional regulator/DNA-binding MarR family transcriptional regulator